MPQDPVFGSRHNGPAQGTPVYSISQATYAFSHWVDKQPREQNCFPILTKMPRLAGRRRPPRRANIGVGRDRPTRSRELANDSSLLQEPVLPLPMLPLIVDGRRRTRPPHYCENRKTPLPLRRFNPSQEKDINRCGGGKSDGVADAQAMLRRYAPSSEPASKQNIYIYNQNGGGIWHSGTRNIFFLPARASRR